MRRPGYRSRKTDRHGRGPGVVRGGRHDGDTRGWGRGCGRRDDRGDGCGRQPDRGVGGSRHRTRAAAVRPAAAGGSPPKTATTGPPTGQSVSSVRTTSPAAAGLPGAGPAPAPAAPDLAVAVRPADCIGCGGCAYACPYLAIELTQPPDGSAVSIAIDATLCAGCGACVRVCPQDVLELVARPASHTDVRKESER